MQNIQAYSDNCSKKFGGLWQYYRDMRVEADNAAVTDSALFESKVKITEKTLADGNTKGVEIAVPLTYLGNFCRILEMPLINFEINLILNWSPD